MEETAAIRTRKLSKVFGTRKAVDKVSIEVPQGAFLSIFGPNGAGKTTLLRMLSTLTSRTCFCMRSSTVWPIRRRA